MQKKQEALRAVPGDSTYVPSSASAPSEVSSALDGELQVIASPLSTNSEPATPRITSDSDGVSFPVPDWDRYRPVRFLGKGGMGRVYLVLDTRLQREVALKFVRGDDPELTRRILLEARAQARVNHERVCKVYEVGEVAGLTFIAMQYVDGQPLNELGPTLTTEQKAIVMRDVALGVHEAHRVGLIHRDLKPANVMVERASEGGLRPYVMDFGLAKPWNESASVTGSVIGTPHYMSPEQARGEVSRLDRRADVYSLGASLYQLLTGRPPISGNNALEVLSRIPAEEPPPPRALDPDVPEDLAAIALRCLEKDRSARYDSTRAMAEDLERFLAGEPIRARAGNWYRLRRRVRKHRALLSVGAAALLAVALALGWAAVTRRDADLREQLARRFTERIESIESQARYSALAPLHDTRRDREALRKRMAELEEEIREGGERAVGPGKYALGRGYLALGEHTKALEALRSAWEHEYREPRVSYALALALGHEYQEKLTEVQRIQDRNQRQTRWAEVQRRYQGPVLDSLRRSVGADVSSADYVAALLAFYERRHDDALAQLDAIGATMEPWVHEIPQLRGDVLWARSYERWERGDQAGQLADFLASRQAFEVAAGIARSSPSVRHAQARLELFALTCELYGKGDVQPYFDRGVRALRLAQEVAPDDPEGLILQAHFQRRMAEHSLKQGGDVEESLARALEAATNAYARAPSLDGARMELAQVHWLRGHYLAERAKDPREALRCAADLFEGVSDAAKNADFYLGLGLVFSFLADAAGKRHENSSVDRGKAIDAYLAAIRLDEHFPRAWTNLGTAYLAKASGINANDPDRDLARARSALEKALGLNPQSPVAWYYIGQTEEALAGRAQAHSTDPRPLLNEALKHYEKGLAVNPRLLALWNGVGNAQMVLAQATWDHGEDPFGALKSARDAFEQILRIDPKQPAAVTNLAEVFARQARYRAARGEDPAAETRESIELFRRAAGLLPDSPIPPANHGLALLVLAQFELENDRDPGTALEEATTMAGTAQEKNPREGSSWRVLAGARGIQARWGARRGAARQVEFEVAAELYEKGLTMAPDLPDLRLEYVDLCLTWAEALPAPERMLERARALTDGLLSTRPNWPEAQALRAGILATEAERRPAGERFDLQRRAWTDLTAALEANPNLAPFWRSRRLALEKRLGPRLNQRP